MNETSLPAPAIDLQSLHLLRLVWKNRGITASAQAAGLSQSALTRSVQTIENRLGFKVFDRSTRRLVLTPAGTVLLRETETMHHILDGALRQIQEECFGGVRRIAVGVSRSVSLAHLPGLLHAQVRRNPEVRVMISHLPGPAIIESVAKGVLDVGVLCPPVRMPRTVKVSHRIADAFVLLLPRDCPPPVFGADGNGEDEAGAGWPEWVGRQTWLLPPAGTRSRAILDEWWRERKLKPAAAMELDSFDLMIQLVALGLGVACVPRRAVSAFPRRQQIRAVPLPVPLVRELAVISPNRPAQPRHVSQFLDNILFS
ncbi:MAG: LysR family transcriptional regulator [Verrucomicrobiota bacterium]